MSKLFIFDMGEVLLFDVHTLEKIASYLSIDFESLRSDAILYNAPLMDGFMSTDDFYRHIEIKYHVPHIKEDIFVKFFSPRENSFMIEKVRALRASGYRCVVGSNTFKPHWDYIKETFPELLSSFDTLYASHIIHLSKPDSAFWMYIMDREGYKAEDTIFIDDLPENIEAAKALCITVHQYKKDNADTARFFSSWIDE